MNEEISIAGNSNSDIDPIVLIQAMVKRAQQACVHATGWKGGWERWAQGAIMLEANFFHSGYEAYCEVPCWENDNHSRCDLEIRATNSYMRPALVELKAISQSESAPIDIKGFAWRHWSDADKLSRVLRHPYQQHSRWAVALVPVNKADAVWEFLQTEWSVAFEGDIVIFYRQVTANQPPTQFIGPQLRAGWREL